MEKLNPDHISFGFSGASSELPAGMLAEIADQNGFSAAGISLVQLESLPVLKRNRFLQRFPVICAGGFFENSLTDSIFSGDEKTVSAFTSEVIRICRRLKEMKITLLSLDLPLGRLTGKEENGKAELEKLKKCLKGLLPVLTENGQTLLLPCRIPALPGERTCSDFSDFLRKMMSPRIQLCLHIHPHELDRNGKVGSIAQYTGFDARAVILHYDTERGETLVRGHVQPWIGYLRRCGFHGAFLCAPYARNERIVQTECENFAGMIRDPEKKNQA